MHPRPLETASGLHPSDLREHPSPGLNAEARVDENTVDIWVIVRAGSYYAIDEVLCCLRYPPIDHSCHNFRAWRVALEPPVIVVGGLIIPPCNHNSSIIQHLINKILKTGTKMRRQTFLVGAARFNTPADSDLVFRQVSSVSFPTRQPKEEKGPEGEEKEKYR